MQCNPKTFNRHALTAFDSVRFHWPEYLMEAGELALYMFFTCAFTTLVQHPASPVRHFVASGLFRRVLMGLAMGATVIAIVITPWGKQSGGHFNPAITFAFYRLGKVGFWDALFYGAAHFFGAISGVEIAIYLLRGAPKNNAICYAITIPGMYGDTIAFVAELTISFSLMTTILFISNRETLARYTPYFVAALYATYITFETPLSGMSMNPARTFGSAFHAGYWRALWIYFVAPVLGMLAAAEVFLQTRRGIGPWCAKLHHANNKRCIFHHGYRTARGRTFRSRRYEMKDRKVAVFALVIILFVAWYEFRPERLVVNRRVHEEFPTTKGSSPPQPLASGTFHRVAHPTDGAATIYRLGDGRRILRFTNFKTSNGPDVHVYLLAANDAKDSKSVQRAGFVDLGLIKGNIGDQNYRLGADVDLSRYRAVSVWCKRFSINFGTAALSADHAMPREQLDFQ